MDIPCDGQTKIEVRGFRSLLDFEICLQPGLNVLVGPNGSGKTNFIEFLDFLSRLLRQSASTSVSTAGGVARVFSVESNKRYSPVLNCRVSGMADASSFKDESDKNSSVFNFEYDIDIKYNKKEALIYISKENLKIYKIRSIYSSSFANKVIGSINIKRNSKSNFESPLVSISKRLYAEDDDNPLSIQRRAYNKRNIRDTIERMDLESLTPDESIFTRTRSIPALMAISETITRSRSYNILPSQARESDDLTRFPIIEPDGRGLSATLHYLKEISKEPGQRKRSFGPPADIESFEIALAWTRMIFPNLDDIAVVPDHLTGKYAVQLIVGQDKKVRIPLSSASDGTIKWLSIICLILTGRGSYSLEEPENFLHPRMQKTLISIIREAAEGKENISKSIISTHSETIVSSCNPDELVIFSYSEDGTKCNRIQNQSVITEEINKTGFGLGKYYIDNAVS